MLEVLSFSTLYTYSLFEFLTNMYSNSQLNSYITNKPCLILLIFLPKDRKTLSVFCNTKSHTMMPGPGHRGYTNIPIEGQSRTEFLKLL
jgi:hypothetical protein